MQALAAGLRQSWRAGMRDIVACLATGPSQQQQLHRRTSVPPERSQHQKQQLWRAWNRLPSGSISGRALKSESGAMNNGLFDWYGIVKDRPERRRNKAAGSDGEDSGSDEPERGGTTRPKPGSSSSAEAAELGDAANGGAPSTRVRIDGSKHPAQPGAPRPFVGRYDDGTWGPTGLYGGRVRETALLKALRDAVKPARLQRVEEVLASRCTRVQCLFENLSDPANGAACLRTMEGLGVMDAHAIEAYEPFRVQGGVTMHAEKWLRVTRYRHCLDAANALKQQGCTLVATCLDPDATPIDALDFAAMRKVVVMFGNEERGLSYALRDAAHHKVYIPMPGFSQSFNISVSCAMTLYHLRDRGMLKGDLGDEALNDLYGRWLLMSTKRGPAIVKKLGLEGEVPEFL